MRNPKEIRNRKIMDAIELLPLSDNEIAIIEAYLSEEQGEETLEGLTFRNLEALATPELERVFHDLLYRSKKEEATKIFLVLFAIGQSTCYKLIPPHTLMTQDGIEGKDIAKKAAVYAVMIGMNQNCLYGYQLNAMMKMTQADVAVLRRAMDYQKNDTANGILILLALYFLAKYPDRPRDDVQPEEGKGILAGLGKLFGKKASTLTVAIDKEDEAFMERYENITGKLIEKQKQPYSKFILQLLGGMAYLNYPLSDKLKKVVQFGTLVNLSDMLDAMEGLSKQTCMNVSVIGGDFDEVFGIDTKAYIAWAAQKKHKPILKAQLKLHQAEYLAVMEQMAMEASNDMFQVIKENHKELYDELMAKQAEGGCEKEREKMIATLVPEMMHQEEIKKYLRGEADVSTIYPYEEDMAKGYYYGALNDRKLLLAYVNRFQDAAFYRRCKVYMLLKKTGYYFREDLYENNVLIPEKAKALFDELEAEQLDMKHMVNAYIMMEDSVYLEDAKKQLLAGATQAFSAFLQNRREETLEAFATADATGRAFGIHILGQNAQEYKNEILAYAQDTAKIVKEELIKVLSQQLTWEQEITDFLKAKKAAERELAIRVLVIWLKQGRDCKEVLLQAYENEKNAKVKALLEQEVAQELGIEGTNEDATQSQDDLVKELHKGGKKRSLAWAYETPFLIVHMVSGEVASEEYLQAILLCYASADGCGVSKKAQVLAEQLNMTELSCYVNELFDKWLEGGAEAKKKWVLYAASIHGGDQIVPKLHKQIQEWPQHARGAMAADAVQALALNPQPQALLIVDAIARKFKFKQVKAAAAKALEFAAKELGLTTEELADKIVPDLGFDERAERTFDYGERSFTVTITPTLEIEVYEEGGKKLKNMPAPGKRDAEEKAAVAYEEFKQMKKQMKTTVSTQKMRLELALSTEREWTVEAWEALFVKNPIMHQFAIGLIWGVYEDRKLVKSFRYMEDGSFNTEDEEEYEIDKSAKISLVHPIELSKESLEAWKQQLEDYEITQPIEQLSRPVYEVTQEEANQKKLERFSEYTILGMSLSGKMLGMGWYRGSVLDGGSFYTYYREDAELGLGAELHFSGSCIGYEEEEVTIDDVRFYPAGTVSRGSYVYDEADNEKAIALKDIPARYFSEIVWQLTKALKTAEKEADEE